VSSEVPFSSERKWSGLTLDGHDTLVLGAPDVLAAHGVLLPGSLAEHISQHAANRRRVVLLAASPERLEGDQIPPGLVARGIAVLEEGLREEAIDTIAFLAREGVQIKIISGDGLATVQAVALAAGVPNAERGIAGPDLPDDPDALAEVVQRHIVFARVRPDQKRALVQALTRSGRYVAMVGDGVNDVLALKEARLAIAMGNGSQMAKGVADLVLLTNAFSTVPRAIEEGRRILRNTHRVARLFVTKSVYSAFLVATFAIVPIAYPFLPRHLTIVSTLTVGLPAFFLALASSEGPVRSEGFLRDVARFAVPVGAVVAAVIAAAYLLARGPLDRTLLEARTITVGVTVIMGLAVVVAVERDGRDGRVRGWVWVIVGVAAAVAVVGVSVPWLRSFFELAEPDAADWLVIAVVGGCGLVLLALVRRAVAVFGKAASEGSGQR
jgi:magnesium-transporting ATPase (P-type)